MEPIVRRITLVDALRGFALFGVVASNVVVVSGAGRTGGPPSALDMRVGDAASYLITGKFLALFSLLFGLSFGLYLYRCADLGRPAVLPYLRRLAVLFLIGAVHRAFFGTDILMTYAVLGAVLLLFRNARIGVFLACRTPRSLRRCR